MSARPGSVLVPGRPPGCAALLDRHLAQWAYVPLRAVNHVPPEFPQAAVQIFLGVREFQVAAARIILNLDEFSQCTLNRVPKISVHQGIAVIPAGVDPCVEGLLVVAPVMVERYAIPYGDPPVIVVHNIRLLHR